MSTPPGDNAVTSLNISRNPHSESLPFEKTSYKELFMIAMPDWPLMLPAMICSVAVGAILPLMSVIYAKVLKVSFTILITSIIILQISCNINIHLP